MVCLADEQLKALCDGSLEQAVADEFFAHIEHCQKCEDSLKEIERASASGLVEQLLSVARSQPFCEEFGYRTALWIIRTKTLARGLPGHQPATTSQRPAPRRRIDHCPFQLTSELTLVRHISSGGVGTVFEARQNPSGRRCAVKILNDDHLDTASRARFEREVRLLQSLDHPGIVRIWEYGEWEGLPYLVMEYVDAESLGVRVRRQGPLDTKPALELMLQVASALRYAHQRSIVHRDLTPANLLLDRQGVVKIIDLGLAKALAGPDVNDGLTPRGVGAGTLAYMAPEQAAGLNNADERSDIYSLAATFCFLVSGSPTRDWLLGGAQGTDDPAARGAGKLLPASFKRVLLRMLACRPADRHQTMQAVTADLARVRAEVAVGSTSAAE